MYFRIDTNEFNVTTTGELADAIESCVPVHFRRATDRIDCNDDETIEMVIANDGGDMHHIMCAVDDCGYGFNFALRDLGFDAGFRFDNDVRPAGTPYPDQMADVHSTWIDRVGVVHPHVVTVNGGIGMWRKWVHGLPHGTVAVAPYDD